MEETTRAIVILAAAALVLAPVMNGVLEEAAATADRLFLKDADWDGEPPDELPDDPPEGEPPEGEGPPPEDLPDGEGEIPPGAAGCEIQTETVAEWNHTNPRDDPGDAISSRANDAFRASESFEIEDHHVGIGLHFAAENLSGRFSAELTDPDGNEPWTQSHNSPSSKDYDVPYTERGPQTGTWTASIDATGATYDSLTLTVVRAFCQDTAPEGGQ